MIYFPNPLLKEISKPVSYVDLSILEIMKKHHVGKGLAAIQVGFSLRMFLMDDKLFVNPIISWKSRKMVDSEEECLSIPGFKKIIKRHEQVEIKGIVYSGIDSFCIQHEIDHLNGRLIND